MSLPSISTVLPQAVDCPDDSSLPPITGDRIQKVQCNSRLPACSEANYDLHGAVRKYRKIRQAYDPTLYFVPYDRTKYHFVFSHGLPQKKTDAVSASCPRLTELLTQPIITTKVAPQNALDIQSLTVNPSLNSKLEFEITKVTFDSIMQSHDSELFYENLHCAAGCLLVVLLLRNKKVEEITSGKKIAYDLEKLWMLDSAIAAVITKLADTKEYLLVYRQAKSPNHVEVEIQGLIADLETKLQLNQAPINCIKERLQRCNSLFYSALHTSIFYLIKCLAEQNLPLVERFQNLPSVIGVRKDGIPSSSRSMRVFLEKAAELKQYKYVWVSGSRPDIFYIDLQNFRAQPHPFQGLPIFKCRDSKGGKE